MTRENLDQDALQRCMEIAMRNGRKQQIESKLQDESWHDVALFACDCAQNQSLALKPWQESPCWADESDPHPKDKAAQHLLRQMLRAGVSRYEPDPMAALALALAKRWLSAASVARLSAFGGKAGRR